MNIIKRPSYTLREDDIHTQLQASTAIQSGVHVCESYNRSYTVACCDSASHTSGVKKKWKAIPPGYVHYCTKDVGTGDWN